MALRRMRRPRAVQQARSVQQRTATWRHGYGQRSAAGRVRAVTPVKPHPRKGG